MKTQTIILIMLLISIASFSQSFTFEYDDAGNRVLREPAGCSKSLSVDTLIDRDKLIEDNIGELSLAIYPNPTKGKLYLQISGIEEGEEISSASYSVYNTVGKEVLSGKLESQQMQINLDKQLCGMYYLSVTVNEKKKSWKIYKE